MRKRLRYLSDAGRLSDTDADDAGRSKRRYWWLVLASLLGVAGIAGSVAVAGSVGRNDEQKSRAEFESSSGEIASTLELALLHEEDLILSAATYLAANPDGSNAEFLQWSGSIQAMTRYPELTDFGNSVIVTPPELAAFAARAEADPWAPLGRSGKFQVEPPGQRAYYCLATVGQVRSKQVGNQVGQDFCANGLGAAQKLIARDTGKSSYVPYMLGKVSMLSVAAPYYRGGVTPSTVQARRAAFLGWFGASTVPTMLLDRALQGHPDTAVTFRYKSGSSAAVFTSGGTSPKGAQSVTIDLKNGWTVQTSGAVASSGVLANGSALASLVAGVLLSLLLAGLLFLLGTQRARALQLVRVRTAQLRSAQSELVDTARRAGMAEIATNVLHNVGNVLNSVNVSADLVGQKVRGSKSSGLVKAVALIHEHAADLGDFLTTDARGKALPGYLDKLAATLETERESIEEDLVRLSKGVVHIKEIVAAQQSLAGVSGLVESVRIGDLVDDTLRMAGILDDPGVTVLCDIPGDPLLSLDRHRVMLILLNLLSNSMHAMKRNGGRPRQISLRAEVSDGQALSISVADTGVGIPPEDLTRIFVHGFTTHTDGHGFGLHSSATAATEMGGGLTVHSDGAGCGAVFTLQVPLQVPLQAPLEREPVTV